MDISTEIKKIALVGAVPGFANDPHSKDAKFVLPVLDYLEKSGMLAAHDVDMDVINFADKRNFLDEHQAYDAVFICHIPNGRNLSWTRNSFNQYSAWTKTHDIKALANTIDSQSSPARWAERIAQSGAKIVATVGGYIEVDINYIQSAKAFQDQYVSLVAPHNKADLVGVGELFHRDEIQKIYGRDLDIPFQWLSIAADQDYLNRIRSNIGLPKTDLARDIMASGCSADPQRAPTRIPALIV